MISTAELSKLLAALYAAPLESQKWQSFLEYLCALTNTASGYILSVGPQGEGVVLAGGGPNFDLEILHLYNEHYVATDPYAPEVTSKPRVGIIRAEEFVSRSALVRSELYNDLLRRYDLEYMTLVSTEQFTKSADLVPLWRDPKHGPMDPDSIHLLETLLPHVQTALRLRRKILDCNVSNLFSETTLDAMSIAAFLVSGKRRVRHMNQLAAAHLQQGDGLRLFNSKLSAIEQNDDARLELLIAGAVARGKSALNAQLSGAMKVSRRRGNSALQVTVIPAPDNLKAITVDPCALVFVHDPSSLPKPRAAFMRQLYALTPTEARIADLLAGGIEIGEIAARSGITLETARFHVKRVLNKTCTHRQTELMRLMLSLPGE